MERFVLTDAQWAKMEARCLVKPGDPGRSGTDNRLFVEAVLWIARTGSPWRDLPPSFGHWNSVFTRFHDWVKAEVWQRLFGFCQGSRHRPWPTRAQLGIGRPLTKERMRMRCLECGSEAVTERPERTAQGYRRFRCRACGKQFNERSDTLLNRTQYPSDVIALVVLWRLRYKLSLRDLPEMFAVRGIVFSYEAVREWEAKLTPALAEDLRRRRRGTVGRSWHVDETYVKVHGRWCYLYRAIDQHGSLVDVLLSEHRDMAAAQAFFRSAHAVTGITPDRVTTDGHDSYPRAIRTTLGKRVRYRCSRYLNNRLEQDHRGIKGRYRSMRGFKCPRSAARFCRTCDELRNFLRPCSRQHQHVPAVRRRLLHLRRTATVLAILRAA
jgi:putative transposase